MTDVRERREAGQTLSLHVPEGTAILRRLKTQKGPVSVTDCRQERKAPVPADTFAGMLADLDRAGVRLESRESRDEPDGRENGTLTFYGKAAAFWQHQEKTKLRMRIRFYVSYRRNGAFDFVDVQRAPSTADRGFLEIKVKAPQPARSSVVDKYRITAADEDLAALVNLDTRAPTFVEDVAQLRDRISRFSKPDGTPINDGARVDRMLSTLACLAQRDPDFIRPLFAISYTRVGYAFEDRGYELPAVPTPRSAWSCLPCWRPEPPPRNKIDVQYQLTVDRDVQAHFPLVPTQGASRWPVEEHLGPSSTTPIFRYPEDCVVMEIKEPVSVASLPLASKSWAHQALTRSLIEPMLTNNLWGFVSQQTGKAGTMRQRIDQQLNPSLQRNDKITEAPGWSFRDDETESSQRREPSPISDGPRDPEALRRD